MQAEETEASPSPIFIDVCIYELNWAKELCLLESKVRHHLCKDQALTCRSLQQGLIYGQQGAESPFLMSPQVVLVELWVNRPCFEKQSFISTSPYKA